MSFKNINMSTRIKIGTLNVNGLKCKAKRDRIFELLKLKELDFVYIQESHCTSNNERLTWEREWGSKIFCSFGSARSKGVCILFAAKFKNQKVDMRYYDQEGRYIVLYVMIAAYSIG